MMQVGMTMPVMEPDLDAGVLRQWAQRALTRNPPENLFDTCIDRFAGLLVREALNLTEGNRSHAAKLLGLSRPTLHAKIEKYQLEMKTTVEKTAY